MNRYEKRAEGSGTRAGSGFTMPFELDMAGLMSQPTFAATAGINGKLYTGLVALNKEWVDFLSRQLHEDFDLPLQLGARMAPQKVLKVYADFYRQA